ncbi:MAG: glycosyltransferase family 2 protein [Caulobacteraceae bacterium]
MRGFIQRRVGLMRLAEWINCLRECYRLPATIWFERNETRRLRRQGATARARVACIVPTYHRPKQLRAALESILSQSEKDIVVIVVDDGGMDAPALPSDKRIVFLRLSKNIGIPGVVRNIGIKLSESDFLAFLDDDNTWEPDHLERCLGALMNGSDIAYSGVACRDNLGRHFRTISRPFDRSLLARESYVDSSAIVARRAIGVRFSQLRRPRGSNAHEDRELMFRLGARNKIVHVPHVTTNYFFHDNNYFIL